MEHHQKHKNAKMQKCAKSIFQIDKENAHILQRKTKVGSPGIGAALPLHSPSAMGRQKKWPPIRAAIYSMYQALASISGDDKIFRAIIESIILHFTTLGNGNARKAGTT